MLRLLADVSRKLSTRGVRHALIGAGALAVHGVSRSTFDVDLLVTETAVLSAAFWSGLGPGTSVDARRGDPDDPLSGVVRLARRGARSVDVVVGRAAWQAEALARAPVTPLGAVALPVVGAADLVLLKLFAGGPQDAWDVEQLLAASDRAALVRAVEAGLPRLPGDAAALWGRITGGR
jgi:hypothetical protein